MRPLLSILLILLSTGCISSFIESEMNYEGDEQEDTLFVKPPIHDAKIRDDLSILEPIDARPIDHDASDRCSSVDCGLFGDCANGICLCHEGAAYDQNGQCRPETPVLDCDGDGECGPNERCEGGRCICPAPNSRNAQGICTHPFDPCDGVQCPAHSSCRNGECLCELGYHPVGEACVLDEPCEGRCRDDQTCQANVCRCPPGFIDQGNTCVLESDPCDGEECSGHGQCITHPFNGNLGKVCACDHGYAASSPLGLDCIEALQVCRSESFPDEEGGDYVMTDEECEFFEGINRARALNDDQNDSTCFLPLMPDIEWSYHAHMHAKTMELESQYSDPPENRSPQGQSYGVIAPGRNDTVSAHLDSLTQAVPCPNNTEPWCVINHCNWGFMSIGRSPNGWSINYFLE